MRMQDVQLHGSSITDNVNLNIDIKFWQKLPEDIIVLKILCKLPAKSLMRFRCVCKTWNSLITQDSKFRTLHDNALKDQPSCWIVLESSYRFPRPYILGRVCCYDESFSFRPNYVSVLDFKDDDIKSPHFRFLGSSNGVLCFYLSAVKREISILCIHNPSIPESVMVDIPWTYPFAFSYGLDAMLGFGLGFGNLSTHDFKVVIITYEEKDDYDDHSDDYDDEFKNKNHVYIYSLRENCWRELEEEEKGFCYEWFDDTYIGNGTCLDGSIYWIEEMGRGSILLSFDLSFEKFQTINLPIKKKYNNVNALGTFVYKNMLCVWGTRNIKGRLNIQIWSLKENSWSCLHDIFVKDDGLKKWLRDYFPMVHGIDESGRLLLNGCFPCSSSLVPEDLVAYDPRSQQWEMIHSNVSRLISYKPGLALIDINHHNMDIYNDN